MALGGGLLLCRLRTESGVGWVSEDFAGGERGEGKKGWI